MSFLSWRTIWAGRTPLFMAIPLFMKRRILNASLNGDAFRTGIHRGPLCSHPFGHAYRTSPRTTVWPHPPVHAEPILRPVLNLIHPPTTNYFHSQKWTGSIPYPNLAKTLKQVGYHTATLENGREEPFMHLIMALMSTSPIGMVPDRRVAMLTPWKFLISRRLTRANILKTAWQMKLTPIWKSGRR